MEMGQREVGAKKGPYVAWMVDMVKRLSDAVWPELLQ